jgi:LPS sulfotransferase NodH
MRPLNAVVICSSERTGSGLLGSALWSTGLCGRPDEYLGPKTRRDYEAAWCCSGDRDYVERVFAYATTPNGVFSMKVHWQHLQWASWLTATAPRHRGGADPFVALAPRVHFFRVSRRDKVRQAVSLYLARQTGRYRRTGDRPTTPADQVRFDHKAIRRLVGEVHEWDRGWDRYFAELGVQPTRIWYEDHLEREYSATAVRVLGSIGIEVPPNLTVISGYRKQADETSDILVRRFRDAERFASPD